MGDRDVCHGCRQTDAPDALKDGGCGCGGLMWQQKGAEKGLKIDSGMIGMESARSYRNITASARRFRITDYRGGFAQGGNALRAAVQDSDGQAENAGQKGGQGIGEEDASLAGKAWQSRFGISYRVSYGSVSLRSAIGGASSNVASDFRQLSLNYIFNLLFPSRRNRLEQWQQETVMGGSGKTLQYTQENFSMEREETTFSTVGTVRTSDGREISFNVNVGMSREFQAYYREKVTRASFSLCDPLVINMDTDAAELSDQTFYFDLDADGVPDEISGLGKGSGYLALDKNGDGIINDGSELFGTASGNGFADLAKYDDDGNGWIDENDAIWLKLKIWSKDENGNDLLYRLADKGVGAICLQNAATDFTLKGGSGQTRGVIRSTGIFLYENGNVGTVQHLDVAKYDKGA